MLVKFTEAEKHGILLLEDDQHLNNLVISSLKTNFWLGWKAAEVLRLVSSDFRSDVSNVH